MVVETIHNNELIEKIKAILEQLRPAIIGDGGDIEFISFLHGVVSLKLLGACAHCPMSLYTLKLGIEERLKQEIPEVQEVISIA